MKDYSKKYSFDVPGLEGIRLESKKKVWQNIEELAKDNETITTEEDMEKKYRTARNYALTNPSFAKRLSRIKKVSLRGKKSKYYEIVRTGFLNYVIIRDYYPYIYFDFPEYELTIEYIDKIKALHQLYVEICGEILELYDLDDFDWVVIPKNHKLRALEKKLKETNKNYEVAIREGKSIRVQYKISEQRKVIEEMIEFNENNTNLKPIHYMKLGLYMADNLQMLSNHHLQQIVCYHLLVQNDDKKDHNEEHRKWKKKQKKKKIKNIEKIAEWIKDHPGSKNKSKCARDIGIHPSTVSRNWGEAMEIVQNRT